MIALELTLLVIGRLFSFDAIGKFSQAFSTTAKRIVNRFCRLRGEGA